MIEVKNPEFEKFLKNLKSKLSQLVSMYPTSTIILYVSNKRVKIFVQDKSEHHSIKKNYKTKLGNLLISHLVACHIQEPPDYDLPVNFTIEDGVAYFFIGSKDIEKI